MFFGWNSLERRDSLVQRILSDCKIDLSVQRLKTRCTMVRIGI